MFDSIITQYFQKSKHLFAFSSNFFTNNKKTKCFYRIFIFSTKKISIMSLHLKSTKPHCTFRKKCFFTPSNLWRKRSVLSRALFPFLCCIKSICADKNRYGGINYGYKIQKGKQSFTVQGRSLYRCCNICYSIVYRNVLTKKEKSHPFSCSRNIN